MARRWAGFKSCDDTNTYVPPPTSTPLGPGFRTSPGNLNAPDVFFFVALSCMPTSPSGIGERTPSGGVPGTSFNQASSPSSLSDIASDITKSFGGILRRATSAARSPSTNALNEPGSSRAISCLMSAGSTGAVFPPGSTSTKHGNESAEMRVREREYGNESFGVENLNAREVQRATAERHPSRLFMPAPSRETHSTGM
jgi:hypothetical protein